MIGSGEKVVPPQSMAIITVAAHYTSKARQVKERLAAVNVWVPAIAAKSAPSFNVESTRL